MIFINDISEEEQIELRGLESGILERLQDIHNFETRRRKIIADIAAKRGVDADKVYIGKKDPDFELAAV